MSDLEYNNSYNNIKRLSDSELEKLWMDYLADKTNKKLGRFHEKNSHSFTHYNFAFGTNLFCRRTKKHLQTSSITHQRFTLTLHSL